MRGHCFTVGICSQQLAYSGRCSASLISIVSDVVGDSGGRTVAWEAQAAVPGDQRSHTAADGLQHFLISRSHSRETIVFFFFLQISLLIIVRREGKKNPYPDQYRYFV